MDKEKKNPENNEDKEDNVIIDNPEDIKKILEELEDENPELKSLIEDITNNPEVKTIKLYKEKPSMKTKIFRIVESIVLNVFLGLALSGLISWGEFQPLDMIICLLTYSLIHILLISVIDTFIPKFKILTFGLSGVLCNIIAFISSLLIYSNIKVNNIFLLIIFYILLLIAKAFIQFMIQKYIMEKTLNKWRK